ncbi:uncharacterized protein LOC120629253 [Pararge aegeria]|uniref:Putative acetyltransferase n=2 Tax=Pararge aegeria TaxID=116150 RepID=S4PWW8_9NEOP|nr:uncharacterized protein LOC120629253 [Pararge aegeria]
MSGTVARKVWTRFESKKPDGSIVKLRIEDRPVESENDVYVFLMDYFVPEEAVHKASGVSKNPEALKEYRELMTSFFKALPIHATVCCVDDDSNTAGKILGLSVIQPTRNTDKFEDFIKDMEFKSEEMIRILYAAKVLESYTGDSKKYDIFYYGRGIIVHPEYRRLGIAVELVKVRELICIDSGIPMTCAWMSAKGSQKAAEANSWKTMVEIPREELEEKTGLEFDKSLPSFKFMYKTVD